MRKSITCLLALIFCAILFVGCSSPTPTPIPTSVPTSTPIPTIDPINALAGQSKWIYDVLIKNINDFNNPSKVRILAIGADTDYAIQINIQGTNAAGGTITRAFAIRHSDNNFFEYLGGTNISSGLWSDAEVGVINKALEQHWINMGMS